MITQDKNHIPWNKYHISPSRKPRGFSRQSYRSFDRKTSEALGTHHLQATVTMLLWMWFLNVWDNVPMDLKYVCQQYFTCMCFLGFIRYNKTFIACRFRKYENLFTQEYHILLRAINVNIMYLIWSSLKYCIFYFTFKIFVSELPSIFN